MKYLLDTNICVFFFRNKYRVQNILVEKGIDNCCISEITLAELRYGAESSTNPQKHNNLIDVFLQRITIIPIASAISVYAKEKVRLKRIGYPAHDDFDLLIGATAIHNNLILVTDNLKDFKRLENIEIENWISRTI